MDARSCIVISTGRRETPLWLNDAHCLDTIVVFISWLVKRFLAVIGSYYAKFAQKYIQ